jgi:hypothetical protein
VHQIDKVYQACQDVYKAVMKYARMQRATTTNMLQPWPQALRRHPIIYSHIRAKCARHCHNHSAIKPAYLVCW